LTDDKGRQISVSTAEKGTSNPINQKLAEALKTAKEGDVIEMDVREWQGKYFGNEMKAGGGGGGGKGGFTPKDKSFDAAIAAANAAGGMLSLTKDATTDQFDKFFEHIHTKIMSKQTK
jgi:diacylglycerol kinase family enzyme